MLIEFPKLEPWQKDLFDYFLNNPKGKWVVVNSIRQVGKSVCAQLLLVYSAINKPNTTSMEVSPILSQSRKMFDDICRLFFKLIKKANSSTLEITFVNDSKILFKSAEQYDTIRGNTINGVCIIDEAAFIKDDVFYSVIVPTTNVFDANIFLFSTPKFKVGVFYNLYMKGLNDTKVKTFDWAKDYDTSKYLPPDKLKMYKSMMPKLAFQSEFLGHFIDGEGTVFTNFRDCIGEINLDNLYPLTIGVDWGSGTGSDYTVLTPLQYNPIYNKVYVDSLVCFNNKSPQQTIQEIVNLTKHYIDLGFKDICVYVEKNGIGSVYFQLLYDALGDLETNDITITAVSFVTTNKSKDRIIKQLNVCFENDKIVLPNNQKLINELSAYECKVSQAGLVTYSAPIGLNDDTVMSLCIGLNNVYNDLL